jgi:hypothetical protein
MNKSNPDLGLYLAEHAIKQKYQTQSLDYDINKVFEFCRQEHYSRNIYETYLKLQRRKINQMVVDIVMLNLSSIQQRFVLYRYKEHRKFTWISMHLHISQNQLFGWNKSILMDIQALLSYSLADEDIFHRLKVINLLHILDFRISTFCWQNIAVNQDWLENLKARRQKYRRLLDIMQNCINAREMSKYNYIVAMKLTYPNYNVSEIAIQCELSPATVSKKLRRYMINTKSYIH